jgi:spermidine/putrescine transport system permease protein
VSRRRNRADPQSLWAGFAAPGTIWLIVLFVVPFYAIAAIAFGRLDPIFGSALPRWNPLQWNYTSAREVVDDVITGSLRGVFARTFVYVFISLGLCFVIGYPVAYYLARFAKRSRTVLLACLILPFWMSYLMRMLAWVNLLNPEGGWASKVLNAIDAPRFFQLLGLGNGGDVWFGQPITVILGLVYGYIPFFILPLYASLDRIDPRYVEAARDLGASPRRAFLRVTLPLSVPGILAASVITALPMFGDYYTNTILSGSPGTQMVGNQIELFITRSQQPQKGAVLVLVLSALLLVLMWYYLVITTRAQKAAT